MVAGKIVVSGVPRLTPKTRLTTILPSTIVEVLLPPLGLLHGGCRGVSRG